MRGRKPGQRLRVFPCWPAPPTLAAQSAQPSNRLLCIPPADGSVNHSPQQKEMIFVYKSAAFGAVQHAVIHLVHVMHDKLWNNKRKSRNKRLLLREAQAHFLFTKWSFKHSERARKANDRPISRLANCTAAQVTPHVRTAAVLASLSFFFSCISIEKSIMDYLGCGRTTFT